MTPVTWNTDQIAPNRRRIHVKQINWRDQSAWRRISDAFIEDSGSYRCATIPGVFEAPAFANQPATLSVDNRWDIVGKSAINDPSFDMEIEPEGVSPVAGSRDDNDPSRITYPDAFGTGIDLQHVIVWGRAPRTAHYVVIRQLPNGQSDLQFQFRIRSSHARIYWRQSGQTVRPWAGGLGGQFDLLGTGLIVRRGTSEDNASERRGVGVKIPKAWYVGSDGVRVETDITVRIQLVAGGDIRITKIVPRAFCEAGFAVGATAVYADDTSTFYPDPNTETSSVDGYCKHGAASDWASLRTAAGNGSYDNTSPLSIGVFSHSTTNYYYNMYRTICLFDTSSLSGQSVPSATFGCTHYYSNHTYTDDAAVALCGSTPASNTDLVNADYAQLGSTRYCDTDVAHTSWSGTMTWALNAVGLAAIDVDGVTKLGLRIAFDMDDTAPTWIALNKQSNLQPYSAEQTGTGSDPYLEVVHSAAASGTCLHYIRQQLSGGLSAGF